MFCRVASSVLGLGIGGLALLWLSACETVIEKSETAVAVTDPPKILPAPISVAIQASPAEPADDPMDRIRSRFAEIGVDALLVVQARVRAVSASMQTFPDALYWGQVPRIATTLTLDVSQTLCGDPVKEVRATYPGGRLPNGRFERTEVMPRDPVVGEDYVFFLRRPDQTYFLELGRRDMIAKDSTGVYLDQVRNMIPLDALKRLCP